MLSANTARKLAMKIDGPAALTNWFVIKTGMLIALCITEELPIFAGALARRARALQL